MLNVNANFVLPTTPALPALLLQCPNALIARSSVLGGIITFKLELYILRYLRVYCANVCHHRSTVHESVHILTVEHECIYNIVHYIIQFCTYIDVVR